MENRGPEDADLSLISEKPNVFHVLVQVFVLFPTYF